MLDDAELEAVVDAIHDLTPNPKHHSAFMTAFEKLNLELARRKFRADLVPASEPALKAMERIGRETRAVIEKRRIVKRTPDTRKVREE